jgi:hypothetical protein
MNYTKVIDKIKVGQVAKRIHEDVGTCNDSIVAIFYDGEHFGYINNIDERLSLEWSVVLCAEMVFNSQWVFTDEYNERMSRYFDFLEED